MGGGRGFQVALSALSEPMRQVLEIREMAEQWTALDGK
jgi:hypothetical protein